MKVQDIRVEKNYGVLHIHSFPLEVSGFIFHLFNRGWGLSAKKEGMARDAFVTMQIIFLLFFAILI